MRSVKRGKSVIKKVYTGVLPAGYFKNKSENIENTPTFAQLTTLKIGGAIKKYVEVNNEEDFINVVKQADSNAQKLLVIGAGSNIVPNDDCFDGVVVRSVQNGIKILHDSLCAGVVLEVEPGTAWDDLVSFTVANKIVGLESLSGIPGTVGACPVQNIGAYGYEVAQFISKVITFDRKTCQHKTFMASELEFEYRNSILKKSRMEINPNTNMLYGPTGRYIVLKVEFHLKYSDLSMPVKYKDVAEFLGCEIGQRFELEKVREAVLTIRNKKATCLDPKNLNTQSVGSYFTNPIVKDDIANKLGENIPIFDCVNYGNLSVQSLSVESEKVEGVKKVSAAKLIENAGFSRGYGDKNAACLSDHHVLVITNRGNAKARDIKNLATQIIQSVKNKYGIELEPEPVYL